MVYQHISVTPYPGALGAEIGGVDIRTPLPPAAVAEMRQALLEHHVIFVRDQPLTPAQQATFGAQFGELEDYPFVQPLADHPKVIPVIKEPDERVNFGGGWHTDLIYRPTPPMGTILHALQTPTRGGDTLFADGILAWRALSPRMQQLLRTLEVEYNVRHVMQALAGRAPASPDTPAAPPGNRSMPAQSDAGVIAATPHHPLVRTHPETGLDGLYFSREHTINFVGMTPAESQPLLDWLANHMTQPVFTTRFHWTPGSTAFWDNRCVSHYALNDYHGQRRHMHRLTIAGCRPFQRAETVA